LISIDIVSTSSQEQEIGIMKFSYYFSIRICLVLVENIRQKRPNDCDIEDGYILFHTFIMKHEYFFIFLIDYQFGKRKNHPRRNSFFCCIFLYICTNVSANVKA